MPPSYGRGSNVGLSYTIVFRSRLKKKEWRQASKSNSQSQRPLLRLSFGTVLVASLPAISNRDDVAKVCKKNRSRIFETYFFFT